MYKFISKGARQFILLVSLGSLCATVAAQEITIQRTHLSLREAFSLIKAQTGYPVLYQSEHIRDLKAKSLNLQSVPLKKALEIILKDQPLRFEIEDSMVIIMPQKKPDKSSGDTTGHLTFYGKVVDDQGNPIERASIKRWGDEIVTMTSEDGTFLLDAALGDRIQITHVSYEPLAFHLRTKYLDIHLEPKATGMHEIQVIGYGTSSRRLNTATVSSLTTEDIQSQPVSNVLTALNGRLPGVQIEQANGMAGSAVTIKIRGNNTLGVLGSTSSDPLYVIDGVPQASGIRYDAQNFTSNIRGMNSYTNMFSILNKEDIERIDILKDADATAIYGARGANGVVLITTKKGREGRIKTQVSLSSGAGRVGKFIPMLDTKQYLSLREEAFRNEGLTPDGNNAPDLVNWDPTAHTDFQKLLLGGSARINTADVSATGGTRLVHFYTGLNYRKEGTVISNDQFVERVGGLLNLNFKSGNEKLDGFISLSFAQENSNLNAENFLPLIYLPPNFELRKPDGTLNWHNSFDNPMGYLLTRYQGERTFFSANTNLSYALAKGLTLRTTAGYSLSRLQNNNQMPSASFNPVQGMESMARFGDSPTMNFIIEPQAQYVTPLGSGQVTALIGGTFSEALSETTAFTGENYTYDTQLNTLSGAGIISTTYNFDQYRYASLFGRFSYDIAQRYLFNTTLRRDASSRFGPDNRLATFWSLSGAWLFTEEPAVKDWLPFLSFGKLKASYGTTGNDRIDNYLYRLSYWTGDSYQNIRTLSPIDQAANPAIQWEKTNKAELNLSLGFLQDRILFEGSIYRNRSSNLLNYTMQTIQSGITTGVENLDALVQNQGVELTVTSHQLRDGDFRWTSDFNISLERNKLLQFEDLERSWSANSYYIGEAVDAFLYRRKYVFAGVDPATGIPTYGDRDGETGISPSDRYIAPLGHPFYGGLNNSFSYKGISLDIFFSFQNRRGPINQLPRSGSVAPGGMMNQHASVLDRWRQAGDEHVQWPAAVTGQGAMSRAYSFLPQSDFTYGSTSYVKLKTLNLSYTLPVHWIQKTGMERVAVNVQGLNLWTWSADQYTLDPEFGTNAYPGLKTIVVGINCTL